MVMKNNEMRRDGVETIEANDDAVLCKVGGGYGDSVLAAPLTSLAVLAVVGWLKFSTWNASEQQTLIDHCVRMYGNFKRTHNQAYWLAVSSATGAVAGLKSRAKKIYDRITADTSATQGPQGICNVV